MNNRNTQKNHRVLFVTGHGHVMFVETNGRSWCPTHDQQLATAFTSKQAETWVTDLRSQGREAFSEPIAR